ncbi:hypothetical protein N2152v2_000596 [Parachlorella kessleri]
MGLMSRQPSRVRAVKARLYELIDRATSEYLSAPNFALNSDVVAAINGSPEPGYAATKVCKRIKVRLGLKNPRVQQLALQLLEHCVRNCGEGFHRELAKSELFVELLSLSDKCACQPVVKRPAEPLFETVWHCGWLENRSIAGPPAGRVNLVAVFGFWGGRVALQSQVLALIQEWAYNLKPAQFSNAYNKLKGRGLPFPPRDAAAKFEPYPGLTPPPPANAAPGPGYPYPPPGAAPPPPGRHPHPHPHAHAHPHGRPTHGSSGAAEAAAAAAAVGPPQLLAPNQPPAKLREDLGVAGNTVSLLQEMLDGVPADNFAAAKEDYVMDMVAQCREMKDRLTRLIGQLDDETLLATALQLNDDAQAAMDRHADMVAVAEGRRRPPPQAPRQPQPARPAGPAGGSAAAAPAAAAAARPPQPPPGALLDLLSLDYGGPSEPPPAYPPPNTAATNSAAFSDPFSAPAAAPPAPSNNPFAAAPPGPAPASGSGPSYGSSSSPPNGAGFAPAPYKPASAAPASGADPPQSDNPFFSDTVFAPALQPQQAQRSQPSPPRGASFAAADPAPPSWGASAAPAPLAAGPSFGSGHPSTGAGDSLGASGNPFAAFAAPVAPPSPTPVAPAPPPAPEPAEPVALTPSRPAAAAPIPASSPSPLGQSNSFGGAGGYPSPSPGGTNAFGGYPSVYGAGSYPGSTYSSPSPFGPVASPTTVTPGPYGRPLSDAFQGLVKLTPKEEAPAPPPPRGTPMRSPLGLSPEPSTIGASTAAAPAPAAADNNNKSALSAFDAFDELLAGRSSSTPTRTTTEA